MLRSPIGFPLRRRRVTAEPLGCPSNAVPRFYAARLKGRLGCRAGVAQPAKLSPQTLWREFVGCGRWDRLPDAFKGAGRRSLLPVADKEWRPDAMRIGNRRTASRTIAGAVFVCCPHLSAAADAMQADLCEFCEHRSLPFPLLAVGGERWETTA